MGPKRVVALTGATPATTHVDPNEGSQRRCCTPDPEDSQRSSRGGGGADAPHGTPQKEGPVPNARQLMVRYKSIIHDVVVCLQNPMNLTMVDDFIALTEDALRGLRTTKMESRATLRRLHSNPLPLSRRDDAPVSGGGAEGTQTPPPAIVDSSGTPPIAPPPAISTVDGKPARSYMSALQHHRGTVSPAKAKRTPSTGGGSPIVQELEKRASELNADKLVAARDGSALRSSERQRQAEERRKELIDEKLKKMEEATERQLLAKHRRESAHEKNKSENKERQEGAQRRHEETKAQVKEKAQKTNARVDEVLFVNDLQQKNRQMKLEMKLSAEAEGPSAEQRREEAARHHKERNDAHAAVVEARQRDMSQQRTDRHLQREAQRLENLKRLEEQKRIETEQKQQRIEEREKKVQAQLLSAQAEAEARKARSEERIHHSAAIREEQREKQKQKLEKTDQKLRDAKERRDRPDDVVEGGQGAGVVAAPTAAGSTTSATSNNSFKPTFSDVLLPMTSAEEEAVSQRIAKSVTSWNRQAKTFLDNYQKESTLSAKDTNKSRLRPLFGRLNPTSLVASRSVLHDIVACPELVDIDHEFIRHSNAFDVLLKIYMEARKGHDTQSLKLASDAVHRFLLDPKEGHTHVKFFVRAGHLVTLIVGVHEEIKLLKKHNHSVTLTTLLSMVSLCVACVVSDTGSTVAQQSATIKLISVRDQILTYLESIGLDKFCFAVASTCMDEEEMACLQYALLVLYYHVLFLTKRKTESPTAGVWVSTAITSLFTLLQNILTPGGQPLKERHTLSSATSCVIFTALRILGAISRWKLDSIQDFLRGTTSAGTIALGNPPVGKTNQQGGGGDAEVAGNSPLLLAAGAASAAGATRNELFHIVSSFFHYVATHDETLEHLPPATLDPTTLEGSACLRSFNEALQFGVTLPAMPRTPLPVDCTSGAVVLADSSPVGNKPAGSFVRAALHELLLLVGYLTLGDVTSQEIFSWGKDRPLLALILSSLPMQYFAQARHILFPTLLSILHRDDRNKLIASREMDLSSLEQFLQEEFDAVPSRLKQRAQAFHEAQEADAAAAEVSKKSAPTPTKNSQVCIPKKSWIEMMEEDDDQDDCRIPSPGHPSGKTSAPATTAPVPATVERGNKALAEKERLARVIKSMTPGLAHFHCDRRFPPSMWVDMLVFLQKPLPPPAPEI